MSRTTRRPLTLHVSALSDAEYSSFTSSLGELTGPISGTNWEDVTLGVREARGWIRGRYGAGVDGAVIDRILKNFCPELGPQDILTGGQFFAVLRLICHAQSGAPIDESLVFVQVNPEPGIPKESTARQPLSAKYAPPPPPRHHNDSATVSATTPALPPRVNPQVPSPNPFKHSLSASGPKHSLPESRPESEKYKPDSPGSSNPFRTQHLQPTSPKPKVQDPSSSASSSSSSPSHRQYALPYASPPLPPRKPAALLPPPRHVSLTPTLAQKPRGHNSPNMSPMTSSRSYSMASPVLLPPPPKPPKPPQATSPLIKQSLQAAKGAQSAKEIMDGLSKERRLEVIKKSGGGVVSSGQGGRSSSGSHSGEGTTHRSVSPPHSFYDVASARIGRAASPSYSNSSATSSLRDADPGSPGPLHPPQHHHVVTSKKHTPQFPFTHVVTPNTPVSPMPSPASNAIPTVSPSNLPTHNGFEPSSSPAPMRRSKSLHHPSPASTLSAPASPSPLHNPPLPPPRRRRPESVQVMSGSPVASVSDNGSLHTRRSSASIFSTPPHSSAQHVSPVSSTPDSSVLDTLHRTIATLRPGAGFESARVKAEGRVWPSGYLKGLAKGRGGRDGEGGRLVRDGGGVDGDDEGDGGFGQDGEWEADIDDEENGVRGKLGEVERDELKLPVRPGEGWRALA